MELQEKFEQAVLKSKSFTKKPSNDTLLQLYALYKQATQGDVSGSKPGMFDLVGKYKYEAWEKLKGLDTQTAQQQYIDLIDTLAGEQ
ncbi:MAG: acyl-CoA-binding protein [Microscillaceae bacterium]|nr:acyl-CoA-binding protein [Microscillaceae bacterium]